MWKVFSNIIEMFIYSAGYMVIVLISLKIVGSMFSTDFERKISEDGNIGLSIICACVFIGLAVLLSTLVR